MTSLHHRSLDRRPQEMEQMYLTLLFGPQDRAEQPGTGSWAQSLDSVTGAVDSTQVLFWNLFVTVTQAMC